MAYSVVKNLLKKERVQFYGTIAMVLLLIVLKSQSGEGARLFGSVVHYYIDETAASVNAATDSEDQLADISGLGSPSRSVSGQGGSEAPVYTTTIQDNSVQASDPSSTDYLESFLPNKVIEYTVQTGDSVSFIASDYGVSVNSIIWANNLKTVDAISPGQILKIPPVSGVIHTIKSGDTVASIAKRYKADQDKIIAFNDIVDGKLTVGDAIVVPDGTPANTTSSIGSVIAGVKAGFLSSVTSVAKKFAYLPDLGDYFLIPTTGYNWGIVHDRNGVDIANSCGTAIHAAADGVADIATSVGWNGGFGKYIKLTHANGTETLYAHLSKLLIGPGQAVTKGQEIGLMGTTGHSTGCHLHFEVHGARNPLAKY